MSATIPLSLITVTRGQYARNLRYFSAVFIGGEERLTHLPKSLLEG